MTRPVRIEFEGALYHVTSRGDRREAIYEDDLDRIRFLQILEEVAHTANWVCHAYCLMTNHYHMVIETPDGNLSKGMRQLNGVYTQESNRRHDRVGHLFQGRYKAVLVDGDSYLLELTRYVVLNPVRAGMVERPGDWPWSSYLAMLGEKSPPDWLATDGLLAQFSSKRKEAIRCYVQFVAEGVGEEPIWKDLNRQIYLGDEAFVERVQAKHEGLSKTVGVPKAQRRPPAPSFEKLASTYKNRNDGIVAAYATGEYSYQQIADFYGLHFTTVGKIVRKVRASGQSW
ncbi:MAG: transposase [Gammaproteobacteria bacterium]|nr:transposase [Gammaproteobacteria bacterium]